jgi:prophage regulatory protein
MLPDDTPAQPDETRPLRVLRLRAVKEQTGLGTSTIYLKMARGEFPRAIPLGEAAVGWRSDEIDAWIEAQTAKRDAKSAA